jgi:hypothetical protein
MELLILLLAFFLLPVLGLYEIASALGEVECRPHRTFRQG